MKVTFELDTSIPDERNLALQILTGQNLSTPVNPHATGQYQGTVTGNADSGVVNTATQPTDQANVKTGPTVQELIAGVTLKPTETSTLGDGTKISVGGYLSHGGEDWHVEATYRGTVVAINEEGRADMIKTSDCVKSARADGTPPAPRAGTAAALLPETQQQPAQTPVPNEPISDSEANRLRELATSKVSNGLVEVNDVFGKLQEFNVTTINELSAANGVLFDDWLTKAGEEPPAADPKFGF